MKTLVFLAGPTAVGKTAVSFHLARLLDAEIISCDSMQVYKGMDIGTGKPAASLLRKVPHHMIDIVSPFRNFSVADFRKQAIGCVNKTEASGKRVIFTGGTALYMKALIDGLFPSPAADYALRRELLAREKAKGSGYLYKELCKIDRPSAKLLHPNDTRRLIRALEVYIKTGIPLSKLKKKTKGLKLKYKIKVICLNRNREKLYSMIEDRVDAMFKRGLLKECRRLNKKRLSMTARQALGYSELFDYLNGRISLKEAKELIKKNTRNFAKRQLSWFRNDKRIEWIDVDGKTPKEIAVIIADKC